MNAYIASLLTAVALFACAGCKDRQPRTLVVFPNEPRPASIPAPIMTQEGPKEIPVPLGIEVKKDRFTLAITGCIENEMLPDNVLVESMSASIGEKEGVDFGIVMKRRAKDQRWEGAEKLEMLSAGKPLAALDLVVPTSERISDEDFYELAGVAIPGNAFKAMIAGSTLEWRIGRHEIQIPSELLGRMKALYAWWSHEKESRQQVGNQPK